MSPFGAFFGRLFSMVATDAMVTALAQNKGFQRLALRIDSFLNNHQNLVKQKSEEFTKVGEQMLKDPQLKAKAEQAAEDIKQRAAGGASTIGRFLTALKKEIEKDLGGKK